MLKSLVERVSAGIPAWLERGTYTGNLVASGDRLAAAKAEWPESRFPTLYTDIPDDIRRPLLWDGRLPGGREVGHLLWEHFTPAIVVEAARQAGMKAIVLALVAAVLFTLASSGAMPFLSLIPVLWVGETEIDVLSPPFLALVAISFVGGVLLAWKGTERFGSRMTLPAFTFGAVATFLVSALVMFGVANLVQSVDIVTDGVLTYPFWAAEIGATGPIVAYYVGMTLAVVSQLLAVILGFLAVFATAFVAFWIAGFIRALRRWASDTGAPLAIATRDSQLVYKHKSDGARDAEYLAYRRQVADATGRLARLPLIPLGRATGTLRSRGDMKAPSKGQLVAYDGESVRNHTIVLGDTGTGKTRDVLRPLFERIIGADWGADHRIAAYVTDGKGTLWQDLEPVARKHGRDDILVIGTGQGHYGVDLLAGMSPLEVSTTFKAVAGMVAGSAKDDFWTESASLLVMHVAALAQVIEMDAAAMEQWDGARPYSLSGITRLITDEPARGVAIDRVFELRNELRDALGRGQRPGAHLAAIDAIAESLEWFVGTFAGMADATKSGIVANVNSTLGKLSGAGELTTRFASGTYDRLSDVDHALNGGILLVAIGETEFGMPGRVVATWLKQRLFVLAKRRLVTDKKACADTSIAFFGDEYQMLATTGPDSDTSFTNIARETGLFFTVATQSVAALKQSVGDEATANLLNLYRNKIVLSTGEVETIDYIIKLAGTLPLAFEPEEQFFGTQTAREAVHPVKPAPVAARSISALFPAWLSLPSPTMRSPADVDHRFSEDERSNLSAEAMNAARQAAFWRSEDKSREALVSGLNYIPKVRHDELRHGQGIAFAMIYRAGVDRTDIIDLRGI